MDKQIMLDHHPLIRFLSVASEPLYPFYTLNSTKVYPLAGQVVLEYSVAVN